MQHTVDYHCLALDFKQDPVIAHAQPIFRREVRQPLHVSRQIALHRLDFLHDTAIVLWRQLLEVFDG